MKSLRDLSFAAPLRGILTELGLRPNTGWRPDIPWSSTTSKPGATGPFGDGIVPLSEVELETSADGRLRRAGRQCAVHPAAVYMDSAPVADGPSSRPYASRYHVADCSLIVQRIANGRRADLVVTGRTDGYFEVEIRDRRGSKLATAPIELHVCKKCLEALHHEGYAEASAAEKERIWVDFSLPELVADAHEEIEDVAGLLRTRPVLGMALFRNEILEYLGQLAQDYDIYLPSYDSTSSHLRILVREQALDESTAARINQAVRAALNAASHGDTVSYADLPEIVALRNDLQGVLDTQMDSTRIRLVELRGDIERLLRDLSRAADIDLTGTHGIRSRLRALAEAGSSISGHEIGVLRRAARVVDAAAGQRPFCRIEAERVMATLPDVIDRLSERLSAV